MWNSKKIFSAMRAGQNLFFGKSTLFRNNKYKYNNKYNIGIKEHIFPKKKCFTFYFLPPGFFWKYGPERGSSHWFLNQNQQNLVVPHIVPRGTSNPWLFIKLKKGQNWPSLAHMIQWQYTERHNPKRHKPERYPKQQIGPIT